MKSREEIAEAIARQMFSEAGIHVYATGSEAEKIALRIGRDIVASNTSFLVVEDGKALMCLKCGSVSHNPNDIEKRHCGRCNVFLDQPESREGAR